MTTLQRHWDARAAGNFLCGGAGSGLLVAGLAAPAPHEPYVVGALLLMAAGLGSVWLEIGRKLRAHHVFFNPFTSWMTRESFAAVLTFIFGVCSVAFDNIVFFYGAALAAAAFLWCQAQMLHAAKGIAAWRAREIVPLIVATGIAEGAAIALLWKSSLPLLGLFVVALLARGIAWRRYRAAAKSRPLEHAGKALVWLGTVAALVVTAADPFVAAAAQLGALAALATGWWLKLAIITRAAAHQGFSLPHLPVRGTR